MDKSTENQVIQLEKKERQLAKARGLAAAAAEKVKEIEFEAEETRDNLILACAKGAGVTNLSPGAIRKFCALWAGSAADNLGAEELPVSAAAAHDGSKAGLVRSGTAMSDNNDGLIPLIVWIAHRPRLPMREFLNAHLRWNGRSGCWRGNVTETVLKQAQEMFAEYPLEFPGSGDLPLSGGSLAVETAVEAGEAQSQQEDAGQAHMFNEVSPAAVPQEGVTLVTNNNSDAMEATAPTDGVPVSVDVLQNGTRTTLPSQPFVAPNRYSTFPRLPGGQK